MPQPSILEKPPLRAVRLWREIASLCFGVMFVGPAYPDDVFKGNDEKVLQCRLRPDELIGLNDIGLSAK